VTFGAVDGTAFGADSGFATVLDWVEEDSEALGRLEAIELDGCGPGSSSSSNPEITLSYIM